MTRVLCPIDFSELSPAVLTYAGAFARLFGSEITVLHVATAGLPASSATSELHRFLAPLSAAGTVVSTQIAEGHPATEIVRYAVEHEVGLVVMGTHGRSGFDRLALGSVAEKVLRTAPCPVLTIPPRAASTATEVSIRQIVCPTDFSIWSEQAMDFALDLANRADAAVTLLHVVETIEARPELSGAIADLQKRRCDTERRYLEELAARRAGSHRLNTAVTIGRPHLEILKTAGERAADLIVMGVRGRGTVDLALFGSTTNHVVRRATCPVVTIPGRREPL